mgnify:CR=1 FL=1|jgi:hypothetical protein
MDRLASYTRADEGKFSGESWFSGAELCRPADFNKELLSPDAKDAAKRKRSTKKKAGAAADRSSVASLQGVSVAVMEWFILAAQRRRPPKANIELWLSDSINPWR